MMHRKKILLATLIGLFWGQAFALPGAAGVETGRMKLSFKSAPGYAAADVISQRLLLPSAFDSVQRGAEESGQNLHALTLDPANEKWLVYVPDDYDPAKTYGVVVGFSTSPEPRLPDQWLTAFTRNRLIFVTAIKSGRLSRIMERRVPMALIGLNGIVHRYHVDPSRIYVFGVGEAAQIAATTALGFGDIFSGGLFVNAQFEVGSKQVPVPAEPTLNILANRGHFVFLHARDSFDRNESRKTKESFANYCITGTHDVTLPPNENTPAKQAMADDTIAFMTRPADSSPAAGDCVAKLVKAGNQKAQEIAAMIDKGDSAAAGKALVDLQLKYGNLIAGDAIKLSRKLADQKSD